MRGALNARARARWGMRDSAPPAPTHLAGTEGVYSRDIGRGNSREGGRECTVGTWIGATVGREEGSAQ